MIADKMKNMVANSSAIRAMFEEGTRLAGIYGRENVFDFSLGNPNVPAPQIVKDAIVELVNDIRERCDLPHRCSICIWKNADQCRKKSY